VHRGRPLLAEREEDREGDESCDRGDEEQPSPAPARRKTEAQAREEGSDQQAGQRGASDRDEERLQVLDREPVTTGVDPQATFTRSATANAAATPLPRAGSDPLTGALEGAGDRLRIVGSRDLRPRLEHLLDRLLPLALPRREAAEPEDAEMRAFRISSV
jgi:hypothetical protein